MGTTTKEFKKIRTIKAEQLFCEYCRCEELAHRSTSFIAGMVYHRTEINIPSERVEELANQVGRVSHAIVDENATV